jgi:hypothetical protein
VQFRPRHMLEEPDPTPTARRRPMYPLSWVSYSDLPASVSRRDSSVKERWDFVLNIKGFKLSTNIRRMLSGCFPPTLVPRNRGSVRRCSILADTEILQQMRAIVAIWICLLYMVVDRDPSSAYHCPPRYSERFGDTLLPDLTLRNYLSKAWHKQRSSLASNS